MDEAFATQDVRNPNSDELVKGHRIVIAELGLAPYRGGIVRDPRLFDGAWSRGRRAEHVIARLAYARTAFPEGAPRRESGRTFVSATFDPEIARSHFEVLPNGALFRQTVPPGRIFMTYRETPAMNRMYKEAEAVLLEDEGALF